MSVDGSLSGCPYDPEAVAKGGRLNRSFGQRSDVVYSEIHQPHSGQCQGCVSSGKEGVNIERSVLAFRLSKWVEKFLKVCNRQPGGAGE